LSVNKDIAKFVYKVEERKRERERGVQVSGEGHNLSKLLLLQNHFLPTTSKSFTIKVFVNLLLKHLAFSPEGMERQM
jgi:hypothetical protein